VLSVLLNAYFSQTRAGLIRAARSTTWAATHSPSSLMRAETEKAVAEIEQVLNLLRRHL
jgi:hypothetical protein